MKQYTRYKILMLTAAMTLSMVVAVYNPVLHKPFVAEDANFKITKSYQEPTDTQTTKLFRVGDAPVKTQKLITQTVGSNTAQTPIKIEASEFYQYANGIRQLEIQNSGNYQEQRTDFNNVENIENNLAENQIEEPQQDNSLKTKILQKKEENIAWNKWRSDLQNRIMMDSGIDAPIGTLFFFKFNVSSSRRISNIRVVCSNPLYQKEAVKVITPIIKGYEGQEFLAFPAKTNRKTVKFDGSYMIWFDTQLSSPENFNDIERVHYYE